jgi:hypothetical protein
MEITIKDDTFPLRFIGDEPDNGEPCIALSDTGISQDSSIRISKILDRLPLYTHNNITIGDIPIKKRYIDELANAASPPGDTRALVNSWRCDMCQSLRYKGTKIDDFFVCNSCISNLKDLLHEFPYMDIDYKKFGSLYCIRCRNSSTDKTIGKSDFSSENIKQGEWYIKSGRLSIKLKNITDIKSNDFIYIRREIENSSSHVCQVCLDTIEEEAITYHIAERYLHTKCKDKFEDYMKDVYDDMSDKILTNKI